MNNKHRVASCGEYVFEEVLKQSREESVSFEEELKKRGELKQREQQALCGIVCKVSTSLGEYVFRRRAQRT